MTPRCSTVHRSIAATALSLFVSHAAAASALVNVTVSQRVTNAAVSKRVLGCTLDPGVGQTPRAFSSNVIYGSSYEKGTMSVPSWTPRLAGGGRATLTSATKFNNRSAYYVQVPWGAPDGAMAAVVNRGIGGAGFSLLAGHSYSFTTFAVTADKEQNMAFAQLRDWVTGESLARMEFPVLGGAGSTWVRYDFDMVPSATTSCTLIPAGSDPSIDCGDASSSAAHSCVRCSGELVLGLEGTGNTYLGFVNLSPGPWGVLAAPGGGASLPVLQSAADVLVSMGVSVLRFGGNSSRAVNWKDWRGPVPFRPSQQAVWGGSLLSGFGMFEVIDACAALDILAIIVLSSTTTPADAGDLIEYAWGDSSTSMGALRIADGHAGVYNVTVFELGQIDYNGGFVAQIIAMETRGKAVGAPPLSYVFPAGAGLSAVDAAAVLAAGIPPARVLTDIHTGAAGGTVAAAASLFAAPPVPGFNGGAVNGETDARTHDLSRALGEATELLDFFTGDATVTGRILARTASYCTESSAQYDASPDGGLSFHLVGQTPWLQPPGHVHALITRTWAATVLNATVSDGSVPFAAQRSADGSMLILRAVNIAAAPLELAVALESGGGVAFSGPGTLWTLSGPSLSADNSATQPNAVAPVQSSLPVSPEAQALLLTLPPYSFVTATVGLQQL